MKDFEVVIRSAKERTVNLSKQLADEFFSSSNVTLINEYPFSKAHRTFLEIGAKSSAKWAVAIDADVLISKKGLENIISKLHKHEDGVFEVQGQILDKFFGGLRGGGVKFYRTKYIKQALELFPKEEVIRPEGYLIAEMNKQGVSLVQLQTSVGLHDFGQYYKDIFRKFIVHTKKHSNYFPYLQSYWERMQDNDLDFKVALKGIDYGNNLSDVTVDARKFSEEIAKVLKDSGFEEKSEIASTIHLNDIDEFIDTYTSPNEYFAYLAEAAKNAKYVPRKKQRLIMLLKNNIRSVFLQPKKLDL